MTQHFTFTILLLTDRNVWYVNDDTTNIIVQLTDVEIPSIGLHFKSHERTFIAIRLMSCLFFLHTLMNVNFDPLKSQDYFIFTFQFKFPLFPGNFLI